MTAHTAGRAGGPPSSGARRPPAARPAGRTITPTLSERVSRAAGQRWPAFDTFRGLAIAFMMIDHIALWTPAPDLLRLVPGRLAMPMFFLIAGYLVGRLRWRHCQIAGLGLLLPVAIPWIDSPNVLVLWAAGCVLIVAARWCGVPVWLLAAVGLTVAANGYATANGSYDPASMVGLMALGTMLPRTAFTWASRVPAHRALAAVGRHPIAWYVGHLLVLQALVLVGVLG